ncbi:TOM (translocase of outer membrane) complex component [Boothiomyces sp. JEL0838]|nr:TOM (translocase of outer membrane) complex component [Boothiomyces sp. JEL0838]
MESFVQKNWKILLGAAIATGVVAGAVYYSSAKTEVADAKVASKKKKPKKRKSKTSQDAPEAAVEKEVKTPTTPKVPSPVQDSTKENAELASQAKALGNKFYSEQKYEKAIEQYTKAIELAPTSVYYCNRAASYSNLGKYELVIEDCNKAIELDPKYIKAFHRRAVANEKLEKLQDALNDFTVVCVLEGFQNQQSLAAPDRILKVIATEKAKEIMKTKVARMPSETFISAYMDSFRAVPNDYTIVAELNTTNESDLLLKKTFEAAKSRKWQESFDLAEEAINADDFSTEDIKAKALNYRGTLLFLMGRVDDAVSDLENSLLNDPKNINTIIKRATLYMERADVEKAVEQFEKANLISSTNPDLYYHRGQVRFLTGDFQGAIDDYTTSLKNESASESSVYVHIQMGVAKYKLGDIVGAEKKFREAKKLFEKSAEVWNYHGEILMDKQTFVDAEKSFDKAISMDPSSPLPYINKAILCVQWKQDAVEAEKLCRKAIEVDPLCDIAYTQLAQLLCHQNKMEDALNVYDQAIDIARTEAEVLNIVQCKEAAAAQIHVMKNFPAAVSALRTD